MYKLSFQCSSGRFTITENTMQIRLHFTALVIPIPLLIDHANILYVDTVENPRKKDNKNNKTIKIIQYRERDKRLICWGKK